MFLLIPNRATSFACLFASVGVRTCATGTAPTIVAVALIHFGDDVVPVECNVHVSYLWVDRAGD